MTRADSPAALRILLVEDNEADAVLVQELLDSETEEVAVARAARLREATDLLLSQRFDCVVLDLGLPDSQGMETLAGLRANDASLAVIVLTGRDDETLGLTALREGAQDYLVKGEVDARSLRRAIRYAIERKVLDEAKSQFIARAAHELRTPLAVLAGLGEAIAADFSKLTPQRLDEALAALDRQAKRSRALITQLLDLSQAELGRLTLDREHLDVSALVDAALEAAPPPHGTAVETALEPGLQASADRIRVEQILTNLLSNAYKHGGQSVTVAAEKAQGGVVISVADDGPGVPHNVREHLFEPFVRGAHSATEGAGLGLAISHRLADALDGDLRLEDTTRGACFALVLPA